MEPGNYYTHFKVLYLNFDLMKIWALIFDSNFDLIKYRNQIIHLTFDLVLKVTFEQVYLKLGLAMEFQDTTFCYTDIALYKYEWIVLFVVLSTFRFDLAECQRKNLDVIMWEVFVSLFFCPKYIYLSDRCEGGYTKGRVATG